MGSGRSLIPLGQRHASTTISPCRRVGGLQRRPNWFPPRTSSSEESPGRWVSAATPFASPSAAGLHVPARQSATARRRAGNREAEGQGAARAACARRRRRRASGTAGVVAQLHRRAPRGRSCSRQSRRPRRRLRSAPRRKRGRCSGGLAREARHRRQHQERRAGSDLRREPQHNLLVFIVDDDSAALRRQGCLNRGDSRVSAAGTRPSLVVEIPVRRR